jgi:hypothetical protein
LKQLDCTPQISLHSKSERQIWAAHKIIRCILVYLQFQKTCDQPSDIP